MMGKSRRHIQRQSSSKSIVAAQPSQVSRRHHTRTEEGPPIASITPPKHVPIPTIPRISEYIFELFILTFSLVLVGLQYLNLYRTIFWLPQSYTKYAMHFHLIDKGLVYFIVVLLIRRFVWSIIRLILTHILPTSYWKTGLLIARIIFICILMISLGYCFYHMTSHFTVIRIIALFYPFVFYLFMCKLEISAFLEVIPAPPTHEEKGKNQKQGIKVLHHACNNSAEGIRTEVKFLKNDCNQRIAQAIFQTIVCVHYTTIVPCIFSPGSLFYDYTWIKVQTFFVSTTFFMWHLVYCFPARYCDILHRAALHLGGWSKLDNRSNHAHAPYNPWSQGVLWPQGAHVKHSKEFYRAEGITNAAEPGNATHARLYALFAEPWRFQLAMVGLMTLCSLLHLTFLITLHQWQQLLATAFVLAASYAALFVLLRDYMVLKKVYQYEVMQQGKLAT